MLNTRSTAVVIAVAATLAGATGTAIAAGPDIGATVSDDADKRSLADDDRQRREVRRPGTCSDSSRSKIKVKTEDNNRIEIEFEVDQNRNGQRWGVVLKQNGRTVLRRAYRTRPRSGSFEARRIVRDRSGRDVFVARARNARTGERCSARATF